MAVILIDFDETPRQALKRGLVKGMAAPFMLFAGNRAELVQAQAVAIPKVAPVRPSEALLKMSDLERLGLDVNGAVNRYEQEVGAKPPRGAKAR